MKIILFIQSATSLMFGVLNHLLISLECASYLKCVAKWSFKLFNDLLKIKVNFLKLLPLSTKNSVINIPKNLLECGVVFCAFAQFQCEMIRLFINERLHNCAHTGKVKKLSH